MKSPTGRSAKPSPAHIIWIDGDDDQAADAKRFHAAELKGWCNHYDVDVEKTRRKDSERADRQRQQIRCIFSWQQGSEQSLELGGEAWSIGVDRTPKSFIEIDTQGKARIARFGTDEIVDIAEMRHNGSVLVIRETGTSDVTMLDAETM